MYSLLMNGHDSVAASFPDRRHRSAARPPYQLAAIAFRSAGSFHSETAHHRLKRIKAAVDPENVIRANHEL
jgi:anaerobic selenocysteine-containing dehydrogenase